MRWTRPRALPLATLLVLVCVSCTTRAALPEEYLGRWYSTGSSGGIAGTGTGEARGEWIVVTADNLIERYAPDGRLIGSDSFSLSRGRSIFSTDESWILDASSPLPRVVSLQSDGNLVISENVYDGFSYSYSRKPLGTPSGWNAHEGSRLEYRAQIRFGEELENKQASGAMPPGWKLGRVSGVATDSEGNVYVAQRGGEADPILVFDRRGTRMLRSWGRGTFTKVHGIRIDPEDNVWVTDVGDHRVLKFTSEGVLLLELGVKGEPGGSPGHFDRPADVAFGPEGSVYVVDQGEDEERPGLGNPKIVRLTSDGAWVGSWGGPGTGTGEFHFPHSIAVDAQGRVYVSDRENNRVQVFDAEGVQLQEWTHLGSVMSIAATPAGGLWVLAGRDNIEILAYDALSGRVMSIDPESGRVLASLESPGHMLDVSDDGDVYVASLTGNVFRFYPGWMQVEENGIVRTP